MNQDKSMIPLANIYQIAYVTADIDRAVALYGEKFGVPEFMIMRDVILSEDMGTLDVAMAYVGETMIELIAPHANASPIFRGDLLDFDRQSHELHHVAVLIEDEDRFNRVRTEALAAGLKVPVFVRHETQDFFYVDTTKEFGHFVEYALLHQAGKDLLATFPRAPHQN